MMDKAVGIVGTYGKVPGCAFLATSDLLDKVGANTGNLVFQYAVLHSIQERKLVVGIDLPWDPAVVRDHCRVIVIPSANFIRENFDFSGFVNFIDSLQLPLVVLGLGVQAEDFAKAEFQFHPSVLRFIGLLRERCQTVALRGEFTASVLERLGVKNAVVTGCPSNFLNPDRNLPEKLKRKWSESVGSIITTGDEPWPKSQMKRDAERLLVRFAMESNGIYVQQSVDPFVRVLRSRNPYQGTPAADHHEDSLRKAIAPGMTDEEFREFLVTRVKLYFDVDQWLEESARFDFSTGLRLHGNMVSFQSGTPAVWIYHDSRTRELAEVMELPRIAIEEFLQVTGVQQLKEVAICDLDRYAAQRATLRSRYAEVLLAARIVPSPHIV